MRNSTSKSFGLRLSAEDEMRLSLLCGVTGASRNETVAAMVSDALARISARTPVVTLPTINDPSNPWTPERTAQVLGSIARREDGLGLIGA